MAAFLKGRGYRVIPVNPGQVGQVALGEPVRATLAEAADPALCDRLLAGVLLKDEDEIKQRFPKGYRAVKPYLRLTPQPNR